MSEPVIKAEKVQALVDRYTPRACRISSQHTEDEHEVCLAVAHVVTAFAALLASANPHEHKLETEAEDPDGDVNYCHECGALWHGDGSISMPDGKGRRLPQEPQR